MDVLRILNAAFFPIYYITAKRFLVIGHCMEPELREGESVFIPTGAIHRIENYFKKPVKIIEVQTGSILRESDIIRYQDAYGRIK